MGPNEAASATQHSRYEPYSWIRWVRTAQAVNAVAVTGLCAYVASRLLPNFKLLFTFLVVVWTVVWIPLSIRLIPRLAPDSRPNVIAMVCEGLSCLWWLLATILLIWYSSTFTFYYCDVFGDCIYATINDIDDTFGWVQTVWGCAKAAAGLAAVEYVLFKVTFIAIRVKAYRQKKARNNGQSQSQSGNENSIVMSQQNFAPPPSSIVQPNQHGAAYIVAGAPPQSYQQAPPNYYGDKMAHASVQQVLVPGQDSQQVVYVMPTQQAQWNPQQPVYQQTAQMGGGPAGVVSPIGSPPPAQIPQQALTSHRPEKTASVQAHEVQG